MADNPFAENNKPEETPAAEGGEDKGLFSDEVTPEAEADAAETPEEITLFDEDKEEGGKEEVVSKKAFLKRVGTLTERNRLSTERITELEGLLDTANKAAGVIQEKYAEFRDPAAQMLEDAGFMERLEAAVKADPSLQTLVTRVNNPGAPAVPNNDTPEPEADGRLDSIIERGARKDIASVLTEQGVRPQFQGLIQDYLIEGSTGLEDITTSDIMQGAKDFFQENGFKAAEVLESAPKASTQKPKSGGPNNPAPSPAKAAAEGNPADAPDSPKTRDEWLSNHQARLASITSE